MKVTINVADHTVTVVRDGFTHSAIWTNDDEPLQDLRGDEFILRAVLVAWEGPEVFEISDEELENNGGGWWSPDLPEAKEPAEKSEAAKALERVEGDLQTLWDALASETTHDERMGEGPSYLELLNRLSEDEVREIFGRLADRSAEIAYMSDPAATAPGISK